MSKSTTMSKKKIYNIVEVVLEIVALIVICFMRGVAAVPVDGQVMAYETSFIKSLNQVPLFAVVFYFFWVANLLICIFSIRSDNNKRDNIIHCLLPILILLVSDYIIFAFFESLDAMFFIANVVMIAMIVFSFIKRSQSVVDEVKKVQATNTTINTVSNADELKKYKELLDSGVISQEEFEEKKKQILGL